MKRPKENERSQRRVEAAIPIQVRGLDAMGQAYDDSTTAVEVSRRGLSFLTNRRLGALAALTIVIPRRRPVRAGECPSGFFTQAKVVRCVKEDKQVFCIGVRFVGATLPMYSAESI
jgi:hypothetical protein